MIFVANMPDERYKKEYNKELQRFEALFNFASIGILVTNEQGQIVLINDFALQQFGYEREELLGATVEKLMPRRFHARHEIHRSNYSERPQSRPMGIGLDLFATRSDGAEFPVEISLSQYRHDEGSFVIAYINNITERKKAEEKIERLNNELEQKISERTRQLTIALEQLELSLSKEKELSELKSRFVSMASHEFRTPLSTILSSAFLVNQYVTTEDQPRRSKHIQRILSAVNLLTEVLNDFLSVGKIEEGGVQVRTTQFNISEHIQGIIQEMQELVQEGQQLLYRHKGPEQVYLDPSLLKHILMNLLGNAIKFSGKHTTIKVTTDHTSEQLQLVITDTGIGISKEDQQHLFERFFRGANVSNIQGTGLGLHIVSRYTELMGGCIAFRSELMQGTTFTLTFPQS